MKSQKKTIVILLLIVVFLFSAVVFLLRKENQECPVATIQYPRSAFAAPITSSAIRSQRTLPPLSVGFIVPTIQRANPYILEMLRSISATFANIPHEVHVFSRSVAIPESPSVVVHPLSALPKFVPKHTERYASQTSDFLSMLHTAHASKCYGHSVLAVLEDDFVFCPHSLVHFLSLHLAMQLYPKPVIVRFSVGNNGLLVPCSSIPYLLALGMACCVHARNPVDDGLDALLRPGEVLTYRLNLMDHIGLVSSVGNNYQRDVSCYRDAMFGKAPFPVNQRYDGRCVASGHMFSPCGTDNPLIDWFVNVPTGDTAGMTSPLQQQYAELLMERMGVEIAGLEMIGSCNDLCEMHGWTCDDELYGLVNTCEVMKSKLLANKTVRRCVSFGEGSDQPFVHEERLRLSFHVTPRCDAFMRYPRVFKICPCFIKKN